MRLECGDRACDLDFLTPTELRFRLDYANDSHDAVTTTYTATEIRAGILLVCFVRPDRPRSSIAAIIDVDRKIATLVLGRLPSRAEAEETLFSRIGRAAELTSVHADIIPAAIDQPLTGETLRHEATRELIGRSVEYTYSSTERYQHIYLNEKFYTWHCLQGSEKGLADTDRCHYRKIAPDLYLFVWCEKIVPTLGVVLVDLAKLRTTGQIFGYQGFDFGATTYFQVGARARF